MVIIRYSRILYYFPCVRYSSLHGFGDEKVWKCLITFDAFSPLSAMFSSIMFLHRILICPLEYPLIDRLELQNPNSKILIGQHTTPLRTISLQTILGFMQTIQVWQGHCYKNILFQWPLWQSWLMRHTNDQKSKCSNPGLSCHSGGLGQVNFHCPFIPRK